MRLEDGNSIQRITEAVVRQLGGDEAPAAEFEDAPQDGGAGVIVITSAHVPDAGAVRAYLDTRFGRYTLVGMKKQETSIGQAALTLDEETEAQVAGQVEECATLVLAAPRVCQLENIANNIDREPLEYVTTGALMQGKEILVLLDINPHERKNSAFLLRMEQVIRQLRDMGIVVIESMSAPPSGGRDESGARGLLSEADVLAAKRRNETELWVAKDTIITPLAWDTAREQGISIQVK